MILVTLGTQDKSFVRLLKKIDELIKKGIIKEEVIVQAGYTNYQSDSMTIFDMTSKEELEDLMQKASLIITHGGVGSILGALSYDKKVIAVARLKKYKEHTNDHQKQIIKKFEEASYILAAKDLSKLDKMIEKSKTFRPKKYQSNQKNFVQLVDQYIIDTKHTSWFHRDYKVIGTAFFHFILFFLVMMLFTANLIPLKTDFWIAFFLSYGISYFFAVIVGCFWKIRHLSPSWIWFLVFFLFDSLSLWGLTYFGAPIVLAQAMTSVFSIILYHFIHKNMIKL